MKVWEETWEPFISMHNSTVEQYPYWDLRPVGGSSFCEFDVNETERAKLAAAAPEMARLLLTLIDCDDGRTTSHIDDSDKKLIRAVLSRAGVVERHGEEP